MNATAKVISLFSALPSPVRGVARMILAALSYACPYGVVRHLSQAIPVFEIVFLRSFLGLLLMLPWLARASLGALQTQRMGIYWLRTGLNYFGMSCLMYDIAHLALQDVTALMFTVPLFTVMFVALLLKERVGPAIYVWIAPTALQWPWIIAMGLFSSAVTQCVTRSLADADAGVVMPFNFLKLPFSVVIGIIWFAEHPDLWTGICAAVIFTTTMYIARREPRRKRSDQTR